MGFGMSKPKNNKSKKPKNGGQINSKKIRNIVIIVVIFALITALVLLYSYNEVARNFFDTYIFRKDVYENNLPTITIENISAENIYAYNNEILVLEENVLKAYNKLGNEEYRIDVKIKTPIFASRGNYLCLADKHDKKIYLIHDKNIVWQRDLEGNIYDVFVNQNGYVAVSMSDTGYKRIVEVFKPDGGELFRRFIPQSDVIDVDISKDNKFIAIAEANFEGIAVQSTVTITSIEKATSSNPNESKEYAYPANRGDLIIKLSYNDKNSLICMYDTHIDKIENNQNQVIENFSNQEILYTDIKLTSSIIKVVSARAGMFSANTELEIINSNNTQNKKVYVMEETPQAVYTYNDMICVGLGTEILFINSNGWLVKRYNSSQEIKDIVVSDNIAGIIYKNKIEIISL